MAFGEASGLATRLRRHWLSAVLFLLPLTVYLVGILSFHIPELYQHILLTITAVMGIHVLDRLFLVKDTEEALQDLFRVIRGDISHQTGSLLGMSRSLEAMDHCGIVQIYPSRVESAADIKTDMTDPGNSKLRIMGISLNDFVQGMDGNLMQTWTTIQSFVLGQKRIDDQSRGLDIKILIIDPQCFGAKLRSESESEASSALAMRLETDVNAAARDLLHLAKSACPENTGVTFDCRLYRLPPILFLCWVDSGCYVQQYHFWSARDNRTPTPVLKFRTLPTSATTYPYHKEMEHHFDWIWQNASIPVSDYLDGSARGTDRGLKQCGVANVFTDPKKAANRITYLLKQADKKVSIQGISLNSFFKPGPLREAISSVVQRDHIELDILVLDPESHQAKYRSYRERLFVSPEESYDEYLKNSGHEQSDLYHDTKRTISNISQMVADVRRTKEPGWQPNLKLGVYDSAPACFILRIDDRVLVEQYHYGKIARQTRAILGKDMPLVEYCQSLPPLYKNESDLLRQPFGLLANHLEFVISQARMIDSGKGMNVVN